MKRFEKTFVYLGVLTISILLIVGISYGSSNQDKIAKANEAIKKDQELVKVFGLFGYGAKISQGKIDWYDKKKVETEQEWLEQQANLKKIKNLGFTKRLEILPLIDWKVRDERLKGEPGVSYLIKTDHTTILFDVGLNRQQDDPSPLMHNMRQLKITLDDFDTIVISHNHMDHVGGRRWGKHTFSLANTQIDLAGKKVYTPTEMHYPGLVPEYAKNPTKIAEGVTTIGTINNYFFFLGKTSEQALAVNVEKLGIVIIVGCGHQTVEKIVERSKVLFDEPICGIFGGLHFPVTDSRLVINDIKIQKYVGLGRYPWEPFTLSDVKKAIMTIKSVNVKTVALSAHDSCDEACNAFRNEFGEKYRDIVVGDRIIFRQP